MIPREELKRLLLDVLGQIDAAGVENFNDAFFILRSNFLARFPDAELEVAFTAIEGRIEQRQLEHRRRVVQEVIGNLPT
jgi:hypothetical protein